jgi:hypothetical protein
MPRCPGAGAGNVAVNALPVPVRPGRPRDQEQYSTAASYGPRCKVSMALPFLDGAR